MDIYTDYANWKFENHELINALVSIKSKIISRFSHTILVVDYLYDMRIKEDRELNPDLEVIFETGFNYIHDHFLTISEIAKTEYRNNIKEMDKNAKTINLLLYVHDFENELENQDNIKQVAQDKLIEFEQKVFEYVEKHEEVPDEMFALLDDITISIFDEYQSVNDIMFDIALDLDLIKSQDEDLEYVDAIFGKMLTK